MGLVKVGMVSVDGTHIKANASQHKSVRYDRAGELEALLRKDVAELLQRAAKADAEPPDDGQKLPQEIARREALLEGAGHARNWRSERGARMVGRSPQRILRDRSRGAGALEGSQLILATDVIATPSDANQLEGALEKVVESVGACRGCWQTGAM
jgi:hypothetical protein